MYKATFAVFPRHWALGRATARRAQEGRLREFGVHVFFGGLAVAKTISCCVWFETNSSMPVSKINATQLNNISHVVGAAHPSYNYMVRAVVVYIRPCAFVFLPGSAIDFGTPGCSIKVFWQDYKVSIVHIPPSHLTWVYGYARMPPSNACVWHIAGASHRL